MITAFLLCWLLLLPLISEATNYYVANGGTASCATGANNINNPLGSIAAGVGCLSCGDTLNIRGGTYTEQINYGKVCDPNQGQGPIVIQGYQGENPTLKTLSAEHTPDFFHIINGGCANPPLQQQCPAYLTIKDLTIDAIDGPEGVACIQVYMPRVTLDGITCQNAARNGIYGGQPGYIASYFTMRNSRILNCGRIQPPYGASFGDTKGEGIYNSADHQLIENNIIDGCRGGGINMQYDTSRYCVIRNNIIANTGCASPWGCLDASVTDNNGVRLPTHSKGIVFGTGGSQDIDSRGPLENQVYNNIFYNMTSNGGNNVGDGGAFYGCISGWGTSNPSGNLVFNNTCYNADHFMGMTPCSSNTFDVANNLFITSRGDLGYETQCWSGTYTNNPYFGGPNGVVVNAPANDFHLSPGSAAINAGTNTVTWHHENGTIESVSIASLAPTDFAGNARVIGANVDAGAFEAGGSPPPTNLRFTQQPVNSPAAQVLPAIVVEAEDSTGNPTPSFTGQVTVSLNPPPTAIPSAQMSLISVDSVAPGATACNGTTCDGTKAIDGNTQTWWFTNTSAPVPPLPHTIIVNLGGTYPVSGFQYLPFPLFDSGNIKQYQFYVSTDGTNFTLASSGTFADDLTQKTVRFSSVTGRYVKLVAVSSQQGEQWTSLAELTILQGGANLAGTRTRAAVSGQATFDDLSIDTAGMYSLTAISPNMVSDTSNSFVISGGASALQFVQQPQNTPVGLPLAAVKVAVTDGTNIVTGAGNNITLALGSNPGGSTLGGTVTRQAQSGIATFDNLTLNHIGTGYTLSASATNLLGATSNTFNILALPTGSQEWVARETGSWYCATAGGDSNVSSSGSGSDHLHSLQCTIPANTLKSNSKIRACSLLRLQTDATPPAFFLKLKAGSTTLVTNPTALGASTNEDQNAWVCYDTIVAANPGAAVPTYSSPRGNTTSLGVNYDENDLAQPINIATNAAVTLAMATQFQSAGTANTLLTQQAFVVRVAIP